MLINTQFHLSNLLGLGHDWTIPISLIYTELLVWASYSDTNYLSEHPNSTQITCLSISTVIQA